MRDLRQRVLLGPPRIRAPLQGAPRALLQVFFTVALCSWLLVNPKLDIASVNAVYWSCVFTTGRAHYLCSIVLLVWDYVAQYCGPNGPLHMLGSQPSKQLFDYVSSLHCAACL